MVKNRRPETVRAGATEICAVRRRARDAGRNILGGKLVEEQLAVG